MAQRVDVLDGLGLGLESFVLEGRGVGRLACFVAGRGLRDLGGGLHRLGHIMGVVVLVGAGHRRGDGAVVFRPGVGGVAPVVGVEVPAVVGNAVRLSGDRGGRRGESLAVSEGLACGEDVVLRVVRLAAEEAAGDLGDFAVDGRVIRNIVLSDEERIARHLGNAAGAADVHGIARGDHLNVRIFAADLADRAVGEDAVAVVPGVGHVADHLGAGRRADGADLGMGVGVDDGVAGGVQHNRAVLAAQHIQRGVGARGSADIDRIVGSDLDLAAVGSDRADVAGGRIQIDAVVGVDGHVAAVADGEDAGVGIAAAGVDAAHMGIDRDITGAAEVADDAGAIAPDADVGLVQSAVEGDVDLGVLAADLVDAGAGPDQDRSTDLRAVHVGRDADLRVLAADRADGASLDEHADAVALFVVHARAGVVRRDRLGHGDLAVLAADRADRAALDIDHDIARGAGDGHVTVLAADRADGSAGVDQDRAGVAGGVGVDGKAAADQADGAVVHDDAAGGAAGVAERARSLILTRRAADDAQRTVVRDDIGRSGDAVVVQIEDEVLGCVYRDAGAQRLILQQDDRLVRLRRVHGSLDRVITGPGLPDLGDILAVVLQVVAGVGRAVGEAGHTARIGAHVLAFHDMTERRAVAVRRARALGEEIEVGVRRAVVVAAGDRADGADVPDRSLREGLLRDDEGVLAELVDDACVGEIHRHLLADDLHAVDVRAADRADVAAGDVEHEACAAGGDSLLHEDRGVLRADGVNNTGVVDLHALRVDAARVCVVELLDADRGVLIADEVHVALDHDDLRVVVGAGAGVLDDLHRAALAADGADRGAVADVHDAAVGGFKLHGAARAADRADGGAGRDVHDRAVGGGDGHVRAGIANRLDGRAARDVQTAAIGDVDGNITVFTAEGAELRAHIERDAVSIGVHGDAAAVCRDRADAGDGAVGIAALGIDAESGVLRVEDDVAAVTDGVDPADDIAVRTDPDGRVAVGGDGRGAGAAEASDPAAVVDPDGHARGVLRNRIVVRDVDLGIFAADLLNEAGADHADRRADRVAAVDGGDVDLRVLAADQIDGAALHVDAEGLTRRDGLRHGDPGVLAADRADVRLALQVDELAVVRGRHGERAVVAAERADRAVAGNMDRPAAEVVADIHGGVLAADRADRAAGNLNRVPAGGGREIDRGAVAADQIELRVNADGILSAADRDVAVRAADRADRAGAVGVDSDVLRVDDDLAALAADETDRALGGVDAGGVLAVGLEHEVSADGRDRAVVINDIVVAAAVGGVGVFQLAGRQRVALAVRQRTAGDGQRAVVGDDVRRSGISMVVQIQREGLVRGNRDAAVGGRIPQQSDGLAGLSGVHRLAQRPEGLAGLDDLRHIDRLRHGDAYGLEHGVAVFDGERALAAADRIDGQRILDADGAGRLEGQVIDRDGPDARNQNDLIAEFHIQRVAHLGGAVGAQELKLDVIRSRRGSAGERIDVLRDVLAHDVVDRLLIVDVVLEQAGVRGRELRRGAVVQGVVIGVVREVGRDVRIAAPGVSADHGGGEDIGILVARRHEHVGRSVRVVGDAAGVRPDREHADGDGVDRAVAVDIAVEGLTHGIEEEVMPFLQILLRVGNVAVAEVRGAVVDHRHVGQRVVARCDLVGDDILRVGELVDGSLTDVVIVAVVVGPLIQRCAADGRVDHIDLLAGELDPAVGDAGVLTRAARAGREGVDVVRTLRRGVAEAHGGRGVDAVVIIVAPVSGLVRGGVGVGLTVRDADGLGRFTLGAHADAVARDHDQGDRGRGDRDGLGRAVHSDERGADAGGDNRIADLRHDRGIRRLGADLIRGGRAGVDDLDVRGVQTVVIAHGDRVDLLQDDLRIGIGLALELGSRRIGGGVALRRETGLGGHGRVHDHGLVLGTRAVRVRAGEGQGRSRVIAVPAPDRLAEDVVMIRSAGDVPAGIGLAVHVAGHIARLGADVIALGDGVERAFCAVGAARGIGPRLEDGRNGVGRAVKVAAGQFFDRTGIPESAFRGKGLFRDKERVLSDLADARARFQIEGDVLGEDLHAAVLVAADLIDPAGAVQAEQEADSRGGDELVHQDLGAVAADGADLAAALDHKALRVSGGGVVVLLDLDRGIFAADLIDRAVDSDDGDVRHRRMLLDFNQAVLAAEGFDLAVFADIQRIAARGAELHLGIVETDGPDGADRGAVAQEDRVGRAGGFARGDVHMAVRGAEGADAAARHLKGDGAGAREIDRAALAAEGVDLRGINDINRMGGRIDRQAAAVRRNRADAGLRGAGIAPRLGAQAGLSIDDHISAVGDGINARDRKIAAGAVRADPDAPSGRGDRHGAGAAQIMNGSLVGPNAHRAGGHAGGSGRRDVDHGILAANGANGAGIQIEGYAEAAVSGVMVRDIDPGVLAADLFNRSVNLNGITGGGVVGSGESHMAVLAADETDAAVRRNVDQTAAVVGNDVYGAVLAADGVDAAAALHFDRVPGGGRLERNDGAVAADEADVRISADGILAAIDGHIAVRAADGADGTAAIGIDRNIRRIDNNMAVGAADEANGPRGRVDCGGVGRVGLDQQIAADGSDGTMVDNAVVLLTALGIGILDFTGRAVERAAVDIQRTVVGDDSAVIRGDAVAVEIKRKVLARRHGDAGV